MSAQYPWQIAAPLMSQTYHLSITRVRKDGVVREPEEQPRRQTWELGSWPNRNQVPSMPPTLAATEEVKSRKVGFTWGCPTNRPPGKRVYVPRMLKMPHAKTSIAVLFTTVQYGKIGDLAIGKWLRTFFYINNDILQPLKTMPIKSLE